MENGLGFFSWTLAHSVRKVWRISTHKIALGGDMISTAKRCSFVSLTLILQSQISQLFLIISSQDLNGAPTKAVFSTSLLSLFSVDEKRFRQIFQKELSSCSPFFFWRHHKPYFVLAKPPERKVIWKANLTFFFCLKHFESQNSIKL